jgi:hypothetical protein
MSFSKSCAPRGLVPTDCKKPTSDRTLSKGQDSTQPMGIEMLNTTKLTAAVLALAMASRNPAAR